ncbi:MAG: SOS response-associated peptidase family protein [Eggerthellaceae bacterium]|jgi:putative SOS response-associated peptidase YedK
MCGRFTALTYEQLAEVIADMNERANARMAGTAAPPDPDYDWPLQGPQAVPGSQAWAIVPDAAGYTLPSPFLPAQLTWGFPVSWKNGLVFNARLESALQDSGMWRGLLEGGRCVVPVRAYFEPHATEKVRNPRTGHAVKRQYRFRLADSFVTYLGGVQAEGRFSIVTVPPNRQMAPIHNRMPLTLREDEAAAWLTAGYGDIRAQAEQLADRNGIRLDAAPETSDPPIGGGRQMSLF